MELTYEPETPRQEDIACYFIGNDRIWPILPHTHPFMKGLIEVLESLPDEDFDEICRSVMFVIEEYKMLAVNAPFERKYPVIDGIKHISVKLDTIIFFQQSMELSERALVGLIAHELAHSIVKLKFQDENEEAADRLVKDWGFAEELEELHLEKEKATDVKSKEIK